MQLQERVNISENKFRVLKESGTDRELYYGLFDMGAPEDIQLRAIPYWDGVGTEEQTIPRDSEVCVCVIEKEAGREADRYEFFYTPVRDEQRELKLSIEKAHRSYGPNAYLITVEWVDCMAEPISSHYIYLEKKNTGERFHFLRDTISAMHPEKRRKMDQYITRLPEDEDIQNYRLAVTPIVRQKYVITEN